MTQTVTDENNVLHYFPDDATPEEMNSAIDSLNPSIRAGDAGASAIASGKLNPLGVAATEAYTGLDAGYGAAKEGVKSAWNALPNSLTLPIESSAKYIGDTFAKTPEGVALSLASPVIKQKIGQFAEDNPNLAAVAHVGVDVAPAAGMAEAAAALPDALRATGNAIKSGFTPNALPTAVADVVKAADASNIPVPNAALLNTDSWAAKHTNIKGYDDYKTAVNQNAADLIGANDTANIHKTINENSLIDARKNNGAAIERVDNSIGNVPIAKRVDAINQEIAGGYPSDQTAWKKFATDVASKQKADGTLAASDIRDLTGYNSDIAKKARGTANDAPVAQRVIAQFKGAISDAATPEQQVALSDVNNKYKLMKEFEETGKTVGAGAQLNPKEIRDTLNRAYSSPNEVQYPARVLQDTLNTFHPVSGTQSPLRGLENADKPLKTGGHGMSPASLFEVGVGAGHAPAAAALAGIIKAGKILPDFVTSLYANSGAYRKQLLRGASNQETKDYLNSYGAQKAGKLP